MNYVCGITLLLASFSTCLATQKHNEEKANFRRLAPYDVMYSNYGNTRELQHNLQNLTRRQNRLFGSNVSNNFHPKILLESLMATLNKVDISDECKNDMNIFYQDLGGYLDENSSYANHMLDAWGMAPQGGILDGNWRYPGRYYECRKDYGGPVRGQWCNAAYGGHYEQISYGWPVDFTQGMCFPEVCNTDELRELLHEFLLSHQDRGGITDHLRDGTYLVGFDCPTLDTSWSTADILGLTILVILLVLAIFGTILDIYFQQNQENDIHQLSKRPTGIFLLSFSVISNTESIFSLRQPKKGTVVPILDGVRFFSTFWVILGHAFTQFIFAVDNFGSASYILDNIMTMIIVSGTYAVDTFFFIGGLLVCYLGMKFITKKKGFGLFDIPLMYLQRYLRLTPPYAFTILMSVGLYKYLGAGPYWSDYMDFAKEKCSSAWWLNLTYINIFYELVCMGWTWYLSVDMLFYILSPFLILALYKSRNFGLTLIFLLFAGSITIVAYVTKTNGLQPNESNMATYFDPWIFRIFVRPSTWGTDVYPKNWEAWFKSDIYFTPWARIHVYMVGMATGYVLFTTKMKIKMSRAVVFAGWVVCTGVFLALTFGYYATGFTALPIDLASFYNSVTRPSWAFCLSWIVIACSCGYGGYITSFLDWPGFMPLSKLTYSAYLVHYFVLQWYLAIQDAPLRFSTMNIVYYVLGCTFVTFTLAYILAVLIEWPTIGIIKLIFPRAKAKREVEKQQPTNAHALEELKIVQETAVAELQSSPPSYRTSPDQSEKDSQEDLRFQEENEKALNNSAFEKD